MLDQPADEPFHRSDEDTVQHCRPVRGVVGAGVLEREPLRKIEVELDCRALPLPADRIDELEVELRPVERSAALVHLIWLPPPLENFGKRVLSLGPLLMGAQRFFGACRQLDGVGIAEGLEHLVAEVEQPLDLRRYLLRRAENVGVVLRKSAHTHHPMQHPAPLVAVHRSELGVSDRQVAVRPLPRLIDADVARTVHRLWPIRGALHVHGAEHVLLEVFEVAGYLEQLLVYDVRRVHQVITVAQDEGALVVLDLVPDDRAPRVPEYQPRTDPRIGRVQIELLRQVPVIAALGLLQPVQMRVQVLLSEEGRGVDALQHLPVLVTPPIGAGGVEQLVVLEVRRVGNVRTLAQIDERTIRIGGDDLVVRELR